MGLQLGANGGTHGSTMDLFIILTFEEGECVFEAKLEKCDYLWIINMLVPCKSSVAFTMLMERSMGTQVMRVP